MKGDTVIQSDLEVLTALNRDYVQSVQDGDVRRFDEILADDFLCSNPDGSLVDKSQFLAQTARENPAFRAGDGGWLGGRGGRDAQGVSKSRQPAAISLPRHIPGPQGR